MKWAGPWQPSTTLFMLDTGELWLTWISLQLSSPAALPGAASALSERQDSAEFKDLQTGLPLPVLRFISRHVT